MFNENIINVMVTKRKKIHFAHLKYKIAITHLAIEVDLQNMYHPIGTEKVAEHYIFAKCSKCSDLGVIINLLKLVTSTITHSVMYLDPQKQQKS